MKTPVFITIAAFGVLCFLPGTMFAPDGAPSNADSNPLTLREYLNLSDSQVQALDKLQAKRNGVARDSIQNLKRKQETFRTKLASSSSNNGPLALGSAYLQLELAKTRAGFTSSELSEEARAFLTPTQLAKLQDLERLRQLQPVLREAGARFLLAPPEGLVNGTGPLGMFSPGRPGRRGGDSKPELSSRQASAAPFPDAPQHSEKDQVVKASME